MARGGPGGIGGAGGLGGDSTYTIGGGDEEDVIYGGKGGDGGHNPGNRPASAAGSAFYFIDGGNGDDTIYGGDAGGIGSGGNASYVIAGGAGNDVIYGGATTNTGYSLDGGDDDDTLQIGLPFLHNLSWMYRVGTSITDRSVNVAGIYAVDGGAGDDMIDLAYALFTSLRVDGGAGFDTMNMRYPDKALPGRYVIDFNAGAYEMARSKFRQSGT